MIPKRRHLFSTVDFTDSILERISAPKQLIQTVHVTGVCSALVFLAILLESHISQTTSKYGASAKSYLKLEMLVFEHFNDSSLTWEILHLSFPFS